MSGFGTDSAYRVLNSGDEEPPRVFQVPPERPSRRRSRRRRTGGNPGRTYMLTLGLLMNQIRDLLADRGNYEMQCLHPFFYHTQRCIPNGGLHVPMGVGRKTGAKSYIACQPCLCRKISAKISIIP